MGMDMEIFTEGYLNIEMENPNSAKQWVNLNVDPIDGNRDYDLFYLLAGVRYNDDEKSYPPIAKPKGLPDDMDIFIRQQNDYIIDSGDDNLFYKPSYLTLKEIKDSGYASIMKVKGWVFEDEWQEWLEFPDKTKMFQFYMEDEKCPEYLRENRILKEWNNYINGNLLYMKNRMEELKEKYNISSDEEIRIVFWFNF